MEKLVLASFAPVIMRVIVSIETNVHFIVVLLTTHTYLTSSLTAPSPIQLSSQQKCSDDTFVSLIQYSSCEFITKHNPS